MNPLVALLYEGTARAARLGAILVPAGGGKTRRSFAARRGVTARWAEWGKHHRDPSRPLVWMHAPSVGEGLQARPVLDALRRLCPELQLAYTFFSPSAEPFARALAVDGADYLPFDTAADARAMLDAIRPDALVFSKLDVWPTLTREAAARGVHLALTSATMSEGSGRGSIFARALLREAYARLERVGAIDADDADRLVALGVRATAIRVTGDTRYDQVWARAAAVDRRSELLLPLASPRPTLVAGSTWPADERALGAAWSAVRAQVPGARLIIAPHEVTPDHLAAIERWAAATGAPIARLGAASAVDADVVLVDRIGVLGDLYALATAAFVGGGFHAAGLHSVLEPAAFGAPVLFGPQYGRSRDAKLLLACGGGASGESAAELGERLIAWLTTSAAESAGAAARELVRSGLGASQRSAELVLGMMRGE